MEPTPEQLAQREKNKANRMHSMKLEVGFYAVPGFDQDEFREAVFQELAKSFNVVVFGEITQEVE